MMPRMPETLTINESVFADMASLPDNPQESLTSSWGLGLYSRSIKGNVDEISDGLQSSQDLDNL